MASAPDSLKTLGKDPKGMLMVPTREHRPCRLPWATMVKAVGCFKVSLPALRRNGLLGTLYPLALDEGNQPSEQNTVMPEALWGDQEPLSKTRTSGKP